MEVESTHDLLPGLWLEMAVRSHGDETALIYAEKCLSYRALKKVSADLAVRLQQRRCGPVIGVDAGDPWLLALALHATLRLGLTLLPLEPAMPLSRRDRLLRQCGCSSLLADTPPDGLAEDVTWLSAGDLLRSEPDQSDPITNDAPDVPLLIVPTSGTTGEPKGVMLPARALAASASAASQALDLQIGDRWLASLPLFHIGGLAILLRSLFRGATVVLHRGFDAAAVWRDLERHKITHISLVPPMLHRLLELSHGQAPPASLKVALIGGSSLDPQLARRARDCGWPLAVSYGMSETASLCALDRSATAGLVAGRVGQVLQGFQITLSNSGAVRISGDALMAGYANPRLKPGEGIDNCCFETGDLGRYDATGTLYIMGRADELLNSAGRLIHPREVERLLSACPGIVDVAVTGRSDPLWGDRLVAVYTGSIGESELQAWASKQLPGNLRPRAYIKIEQLPRNSLGKVDRNALKSQP